jgi:tetratricopeptide (TPR) repeat protein
VRQLDGLAGVRVSELAGVTAGTGAGYAYRVVLRHVRGALVAVGVQVDVMVGAHVAWACSWSPSFAKLCDSLAQTLELFRDLGERCSEGEILSYLGELSLAAGSVAEARDRFEHALAIATSVATPPEQARALEGIGRCHLRDGHVDEASDYLGQALEIYQRLGSSAAEPVRQALREHGR